MRRQFATFTLDGQLLGVPVGQVQEVIRAQPFTPVPLADTAVAGLMNLRGQVVTVIDLRRRMGAAAGPDDAQPMTVVVRVDREVVGLLVDGIVDVLDLADADLAGPPETLRGPRRDLVRGVYALESAVLLVLDVERAVAV